VIVQCCDFVKVLIGIILFRRGIWITNLVGGGEDVQAA